MISDFAASDIIPTCIFLRHLEGGCFSVAWVSALSVVIGRFGETSISTSFAVVNSAGVTGFMIGPAVGTWILACTKNYFYPFILTGSLSFLAGLILLLFCDSQSHEAPSSYDILEYNVVEGSKFSTVKNVMSLTHLPYYLLILPVPCIAVGCYEVSISPYFDKTYSLLVVAMLWLLTTGLYTLTSLVCGVLYDKGCYHIIIGSSSVLTVGCAGLWLRLPIFIQAMLLFCFPLACASLIAPIYRFIRFAFLDVQHVENVDLLVSSIINAIYSLSRGSGAFIFGGVLWEALGFHGTWLCLTLLALMAFGLCVILAVNGTLSRLKEQTLERAEEM